MDRSERDSYYLDKVSEEIIEEFLKGIEGSG